MELKRRFRDREKECFRSLNRTFYGIETIGNNRLSNNISVLIVPFMELKPGRARNYSSTSTS